MLSKRSGQDAKAVTTDAVVGPEQLAQLTPGSELDKRVARGEFPATAYLAFTWLDPITLIAPRRNSSEASSIGLNCVRN